MEFHAKSENDGISWKCVEFHENDGFAPLPAPGLQKQYELLLYFACPGAPDSWNSMNFHNFH